MTARSGGRNVTVAHNSAKKNVNAADLNIRICSECGSKLRNKTIGVCGPCIDRVKLDTRNAK